MNGVGLVLILVGILALIVGITGKHQEFLSAVLGRKVGESTLT